MSHRIALALLAAALPLACPAAGDDVHLDTDVQKFSYAIGLSIGHNLRQQGLQKIDPKAVALAIDDIVNGRPLRLTVEQMKAAQEGYRTALLEERATLAESNKKAGEAFLAANGKKEGITVLDSGLQYRVIKAGTGEKPTETDKVKVNYRGWLLDGTEFDSSYSRGEPAVLTVSEVIPGWQEVLKRMPVGSHWEVWIPHALAYGQNGAGAAIGPNQTLHFDIELLSIEGG